MTELRHGDWVLVADGEKALILENLGDEAHWNLGVRRKALQENPPTREQGAHKPGRMPDSGPNQASALDDSDWHELGKARFAEDLAGLLYARAHAGAFRAIALAADPRTLGRLREELHAEVRDRVLAEIAKDLTGQPVHEIERRVAEALPDPRRPAR